MSDEVSQTLYILVPLAYLVVMGLAGVYVAMQVRRPLGEGVALACLFGPLGLILVALLPPLNPPGAFDANGRPARTPVKRSKLIDDNEADDPVAVGRLLKRASR